MLKKRQVFFKDLPPRQNRTIVEESKSVDLERKNKEIEELQNKIQSNITLQDRKEENLRLCNEEIIAMNQKLSENDELKSIQDSLKEKEQLLTSYEGHLNDKKKAVKDLLVKASPALLMRDHFINADNYLDQIVSKEDSIVPIEVLEMSLRNNVCACCNNDLDTHLTNLNYVRALKENYKRSVIGTFTGSIKKYD